MSEIEFPIVGIGASAGGLKALQDFFEKLPSNSGMAFVVISHLAPQKTSVMDELLASHSALSVVQVSSKKTTLQPNHIYVIPPAKQLEIEESYLLLSDKDKEMHTVIDLFFRSMARECENQAIGIILSGTGSDGTLGLKAVKEYGGVTMVQDPSEADYNSMPRSAIDTGMVDFILPVNELAQKVMDQRKILGELKLPLNEGELSDTDTSALKKIFELLISKETNDFSHYKRSSVLRRLQRRMVVTGNKTISNYLSYINKEPEEVTKLYNDLLISVTRFFRDPKAFKSLETEVIPKIFEEKGAKDPIRAWIVGCATGEEVYSLAIVLNEYASKLDYMPQIKLFGTDISDEALAIARKGVYPETISTDMSEERLQRYFHKENGNYRISNAIRKQVLISKHNILADPPFVNQDLISCRNLLIYFNKNLQHEALKILHHSLNKDGYLFLGGSDSTIAAADYFQALDKPNGIYQSRLIPESQKEIPLPLLRNMANLNTEWLGSIANKKNVEFEKIHQALLAKQYAPPSVIVDEKNRVMHSSRGIDQYLHYREGEPSRDLLNMVSMQLRRPLQNIIFQFNKQDNPEPISKKIKLDHHGELLSLNLQIRPINKKGVPKGYRQIVFEEIEQPSSIHGAEEFKDLQKFEESEVVQQLEKELEQTREQLQQIIEEYEASNEELMASNEELQSMNEELQTTAEELETSKEELQSVNEELKIVNEERESKIEELQQVNDDLKNLMNASEIGIMFLNLDLEIKRYTNSANELFNLIDSDVNRPLSHITHKIQDVDLEKEIKNMLNTLEPFKEVVYSTDGQWYSLRIKPYKTTEHKVEGAILSFMDITDLKKAEQLIQARAENEESLVKLGVEYLEYENPQKVLDRATDMLRERLDFSSLAIFKMDTDQKNLQLASGHGWREEEIGNFSIPLDTNTVFDYAMRTESPVVVTDFDHEERFERLNEISSQNFTSGITAVIYGSKSNFGFLGAYSRDRRSYAEHEINFIKNTAYRIGEALERIETEKKLTEINQKLQEKIELQKQLQQDVLRVEKKERWSIGQFLHDEISQNLLAIKTLLDSSPQIKKLDKKTRDEIDEIKELILQSLKNIRELSHFVLPLGEGVGCAIDALNLLIKQTENVYDVTCTLSSDEFTGGITDNSITSSLYYIAQEAITNSIKHGKADYIGITLSSRDGQLFMTVEDNGTGYDEEHNEKGQGINIMKYRAELLGDTLDITSVNQEGGTLVKCVLPLDKNTRE